MRLLTRLRSLSTGRLWAVLLLSAGLNAVIVGYVIIYLPIVPIGPICADQETAWRIGPGVEVKGDMAWPFIHAYEDALSELDHLIRRRRIYVTVLDWLEGSKIGEASRNATHRLLSEHAHIPRSDPRYPRVGVPEFDEVAEGSWPSCGAMRKLALEGGEWAYTGPVPKQMPPK